MVRKKVWKTAVEGAGRTLQQGVSTRMPAHRVAAFQLGVNVVIEDWRRLYNEVCHIRVWAQHVQSVFAAMNGNTLTGSSLTMMVQRSLQVSRFRLSGRKAACLGLEYENVVTIGCAELNCEYVCLCF